MMVKQTSRAPPLPPAHRNSLLRGATPSRAVQLPPARRHFHPHGANLTRMAQIPPTRRKTHPHGELAAASLALMIVALRGGRS